MASGRPRDRADEPASARPRLVDDDSGRAGAAGEAAGEVVGRGLGALVVLAVLLVAFGPFLWLPLYLALAAWRSAPDDGLWRVASPLLAFAGVLALQALLAVQKSRYVRTPAVVLPAFAWSAGLYLAFTTPGHVWGELPEWRAPGTTGWIVIAAGTVLYTGLFLFLLQRLDRKRWVKRLQVFR